MIQNDQKTVRVNADNDLKFRDSVQATKKKQEDISESANGTSERPLEYFTE